MLMLQVTCLVELIEMPFTVVACADILLVNLERVGFNLRNFDMTIIYKARSLEAQTLRGEAALSHGRPPCRLPDDSRQNANKSTQTGGRSGLTTQAPHASNCMLSRRAELHRPPTWPCPYACIQWLLYTVYHIPVVWRPQDLTRDVLRIDAIPSTSLDGVKEWLGSMDIKFYESKVRLYRMFILCAVRPAPPEIVSSDQLRAGTN